MNNAASWRLRFEEELSQALIARQAGNEGRARVCARRAAGIAIGEFLRRKAIPSPGPSAYDRLRYLVSQGFVDAKVKEIAGHFLLHIKEDRSLPVQADLIEEASWLAEQLLN